jgi:hypothetical protein
VPEVTVRADVEDDGAPCCQSRYVSPAIDSDEPLDPIEAALVRALVNIIVREIRGEAVERQVSS